MNPTPPRQRLKSALKALVETFPEWNLIERDWCLSRSTSRFNENIHFLLPERSRDGGMPFEILLVVDTTDGERHWQYFLRPITSEPWNATDFRITSGDSAQEIAKRTTRLLQSFGLPAIRAAEYEPHLAADSCNEEPIVSNPSDPVVVDKDAWMYGFESENPIERQNFLVNAVQFGADWSWVRRYLLDAALADKDWRVRFQAILRLTFGHADPEVANAIELARGDRCFLVRWSARYANEVQRQARLHAPGLA